MASTQVAAALVIAQLDSGWEGSVRESALRSLLLGPPDWTGVASVIALTEIATRDPKLREPIQGLVAFAVQQAPNQGGWCLQDVLTWSQRRLST